jgi:hypothetical protein
MLSLFVVVSLVAPWVVVIIRRWLFTFWGDNHRVRRFGGAFIPFLAKSTYGQKAAYHHRRHYLSLKVEHRISCPLMLFYRAWEGEQEMRRLPGEQERCQEAEI